MTSFADPRPPARPALRRAAPASRPFQLADRRGLTATGAVTVALLLGAVGGLIDVMTGPGLRTVFAIFFIGGCVLAALKVHREDLAAAVVMPPLLYVVLALFAGLFSQSSVGGSLLTQQALELASSLVLGAPVLMTATGLALVIAVTRGLTSKRRQSADPP